MRLEAMLFWTAAALTIAASEVLKERKELSFPNFDERLFAVDGAAVRRAHSHVPLESVHKANHELYQKISRAPLEELHEVVFGIKGRHLDKLEELVRDISDPSSTSYGDYLTHQELVELTSNIESAEHVQNYLLQIPGMNNVRTTEHADFVIAKAPISVWEEHLHCQFDVYELKEEYIPAHLAQKPIHVIRSTEYFVETPLVGHVDFVFNTIHFPPPPATEPVLSSVKSKASTEDVVLSGFVTPDLLVQNYGIDRSVGKNNKVSQAVFATSNYTYFSPRDLADFFDFFSLPNNEALQVGEVRGDDSQCAMNPDGCSEGNVDLQYIMSTAPNVPTTFYFWLGQDFLLGTLIQMNSLVEPPAVMIISYGTYESNISPSYASSFNVQAMKLAARGSTIVAASGDNGVAGEAALYDSRQCGYRPVFPASSPYVLAVGGTMGVEFGNLEVACQGDSMMGTITSGGGFSDLFPTPDYQRNAVNSYLAASAPAQKGYNAAGRAYPDISALARNYAVFLNQGLVPVSGTSASAAVIAGMISLVNAARTAAGKSTLGWVNPALYALSSSAFKDIMMGSNECVFVGHVCCAQGFKAARGWDPVTGLGAVYFASFQRQLVALGKAGTPSRAPSISPSVFPSNRPVGPTRRPTASPIGPTKAPSSKPTVRPTAVPTTPTVAPSRLPSPYPSIQTTPAPSQAKGWLYFTQYADKGCAAGPIDGIPGLATHTAAVPSSTCLALYDRSGRLVGSKSLRCGGDKATYTYFSDAACSQSRITRVYDVFYGCANVVVNGNYGEEYVSTSITCQAGATPSFPTVQGKAYVQKTTYNSPGVCDSSKIAIIDTVLSEYCIYPLVHLLFGVAYKMSFPNMTAFSDTSCAIPLQITRLATACSRMTADDDTLSESEIVMGVWAKLDMAAGDDDDDDDDGDDDWDDDEGGGGGSRGGGSNVGSWLWAPFFLTLLGVVMYLHYQSKLAKEESGNGRGRKAEGKYRKLEYSGHGGGKGGKNSMEDDPDTDLL